ncbi:cupin domain-containing protein [Streptomyces sp. NP160]|uniref:quercetin 2,3-dioxygenase n=1 Tax=Streptomyces sp. NP160 TaxID=2586637 RepID=UPI00111825DD|nr:quercetin 2,3-dioxygenase [Streptomyces sp. NP160]TNM63145.1 cupin domain-containing protein [Streptomyces sp. NP160]
MSIDLEVVHGLSPVRNALPGEPVPYAVAHGEGLRYELDGQLWTVFARASDTGGLFDAAWVDGPRGSVVAPHAHRDQQRSFVVVKGSVRVQLGASARVLVPGDSFTVPAGTPVGWRFLAHTTRLLVWAAPGGALDLVERLGTPVDVHAHRDAPSGPPAPGLRREAGEALGVTFPSVEEVLTSDAWDAELPAGVEPYFLRAGEGDRLRTPDALYTYLSRGRNTDHRYFAIHTVGAPGQYFGRHFHRQHTENFVCLAGRVWLWVNGTELLLTPGDFVHAPAGTIHTFAFDAHRTEMLGILSPDVFEPFFGVLGSSTQDRSYAEPGTMSSRETDLVGPPPVHVLQKLQDELDLVLVGPPPQRLAGRDV